MNEAHAARGQWRALWKEDLAAHSIPNNMLLDAPGAAEAWAAAREVRDRLAAFEEEILASPIASWADIGLLAEIAFSRMWPGCLLDSAEAPTVVSRGPDCMEQGEDNAIGRLFLGIRQLTRESAASPPCSKTASAGVKDAAAEIMTLINARPSSPRVEEIEAVIARAVGPATSPCIDRDALAAWDAAVRAYCDGADGTDDARASRLLDDLCVTTQATWDRPVRSWADVVLLAAVCVHWNTPGNADEPAYPDCVLAAGPEHQMDQYGTAKLVRAVLDLAGLRFDLDGRLLSPAA